MTEAVGWSRPRHCAALPPGSGGSSSPPASTSRRSAAHTDAAAVLAAAPGAGGGVGAWVGSRGCPSSRRQAGACRSRETTATRRPGHEAPAGRGGWLPWRRAWRRCWLLPPWWWRLWPPARATVTSQQVDEARRRLREVTPVWKARSRAMRRACSRSRYSGTASTDPARSHLRDGSWPVPAPPLGPGGRDVHLRRVGQHHRPCWAAATAGAGPARLPRLGGADRSGTGEPARAGPPRLQPVSRRSWWRLSPARSRCRPTSWGWWTVSTPNWIGQPGVPVGEAGVGSPGGRANPPRRGGAPPPGVARYFDDTTSTLRRGGNGTISQPPLLIMTTPSLPPSAPPGPWSPRWTGATTSATPG